MCAAQVCRLTAACSALLPPQDNQIRIFADSRELSKSMVCLLGVCTVCFIVCNTIYQCAVFPTLRGYKYSLCVDTDPNTNSTHVTLVQLCGAVLCKHCLQAGLV